MTISKYILTILLASCNAKIIPGKYAVVKELSYDKTADAYKVVSDLKDANGDKKAELTNWQPFVNFQKSDTVYVKRLWDTNQVRLFKL